MTKEQKAELEQLSQEFLGSRSKWKKIVDKGESVLVRDADGKPSRHAGMEVFVKTRQTWEQVLENLRARKRHRDAVVEKWLANQREAKRVAEEQARAQAAAAEAGGSAK
jgi:hypothetical protein